MISAFMSGSYLEIEAVVGRLCQTPTLTNGVSQKRPTIPSPARLGRTSTCAKIFRGRPGKAPDRLNAKSREARNEAVCANAHAMPRVPVLDKQVRLCGKWAP